MDASAGKLGASAIAPALRVGAVLAHLPVTHPPQAARAGTFGAGQICGPFGPQFAGFAEAPEPPLALRFGGTARIALGIATLAAVLMLAGVK